MSLTVLRPGPLTTVQDLGRRGAQRFGVSVGGAMDGPSLRIANLLVGNPEEAAGLEATLQGPTLRFEADALLSLGGAESSATLDGRPIPRWRAFAAPAGSVLELAVATEGCRAYVAVAGGIDVPVVLGGRGTELRARFGGHEGRALRTGDVLPIGAVRDAVRGQRARLLASAVLVESWGATPAVVPRIRKEEVVRFIAGPELRWFEDESLVALTREPYELTPQSNRMGARLRGVPLKLREPRELISSPVCEGTVQVPADGQPIVLMADRQTTGGYPRIGQVISVDLPALAQLRPGSKVRFGQVSVGEAHLAMIAREEELARFGEAVRLRTR